MNNEARILITGDFCPINRISGLILDKNFEAIFNDFIPIIKENDLAITNLESPLTIIEKRINKTGPAFKAPLDTARALSNAGFKLVTLANNHIMDYGISGLKSTLQACKNNDIEYVGVGENYAEARQVYYIQVEGHNIAILNFTEDEFSTTHGNYPGANPIDPIINYNDIVQAKAKSNYVIVIVHSGHEYFDLPSPRIKKTYRFFADAGADAIFGHHSHYYSGFEIYKNVPIFYSLGNFVFDSPKHSSPSFNSGFAVELILGNTLTYNIIPYWQCNLNVGIELMNENGKELFYNNIKRLNHIIADDTLINAKFKNYCRRVSKMYFSLLEPHSNRLIHFLQNRKFLPSLLSKRKKNLYLNLMRCEIHRDVIINLLDSRDPGNNVI
jgi:poly-gamma-glutamate synthesis protein (capsule biosynthesis protein)